MFASKAESRRVSRDPMGRCVPVHGGRVRRISTRDVWPVLVVMGLTACGGLTSSGSEGERDGGASPGPDASGGMISSGPANFLWRPADRAAAPAAPVGASVGLPSSGSSGGSPGQTTGHPPLYHRSDDSQCRQPLAPGMCTLDGGAPGTCTNDGDCVDAGVNALLRADRLPVRLLLRGGHVRERHRVPRRRGLRLP